ncbi:uncharacterized protein [Dermacentor albipictus]|uniref:uncharacterized protein isoform X2 n=2 Tax=Dermacentor albipictus TaxID=60249 RepID=UPI0038FCAEC8
MAGGIPAWSPLHPSPGFLLKCGKEHEKLKLRIRSQLQSHMLSLFEDGLFSDVTIESSPGDSSEGLVLKAHKAVLLVRVPAFWKLLVEKFAVSRKGTNEFIVPVDKDSLRDFLRSVYSDDDIRKKEHDILRVLCTRDGPPSSDDGDEDFHDMTGETNTEEGTRGTAENSAPTGPDRDIDGVLSGSLGQMGAEDSLENFRACFVNDSDACCMDSHAPTTSNLEEPLDSLCDNSQVYDESQACNDVSENRDECSVSMSSSMVRSGTFDLQSQMPLEVAIEKWNGDETAALIGTRECEEQRANAEPKALDDRKTSAKVCAEQDGKSLAPMPAFFLHERSSAPMPVSYQCLPRTPKVAGQLGERVGSAGASGMNDSGFLSQNTSVTEAVAYDSLNDTREAPSQSATEQGESRANQGHHSSGALFPFYIDMNKARAEEKQSQQQREPSNQGSSLYMYIDANGDTSASQVQKKSPSSNSKADDSSKRPQSCYMYVDFNTVHHEESQPDERSFSRTMPRTLSLSMFIDINDDHNESVVCAQKAYSNYQGNPAKDGDNAVEGQRSFVEHRMWEHFEREEILVVSEEIPAAPQPTRPCPAVSSNVSSPRRAASDYMKAEPSEVCLLPMSPILRHKGKPEPVKPAPRTLPVKSSIRPQDVDAMTFRRPEPCGGEDSDSLEQESDKEADVPKKKLLPKEEEVVAAAMVKGSDSGPDPSTSLAKKTESDVPAIEAQTSAVQESPAIATKESISRPPFSPGDGDDDSETVYSEVSEVSCLSSIDNRMQESGCSPERLGACSKLGDDLLRMFIGQVETDVTIHVEGKDIGAHRFILASRSDYFSLIFRKEFAAEESETISMDGFTHGAVVFALHHLYGGAASPPREVHISELALLAEVLGVDSLRRVVLSHVRTYYCHFFHKPCSQCIAGVAECLQMAPCFSGLRELQTRAVQWAGRHYVRVWPHRAFATVPEPWQQQCYAATLQTLTAETAVDMALNCERLSVTLPRVRWAESALSLANRLLHDCVCLMSREFDQVLQSKGFLDLGKGQSWNITALEDTLLVAVEGLTPDAACLSCIVLARLLPEDDSQQSQWTQNFTDLLRKIQRQCERFLIHNANRVVHCQSWSSLSPRLQKKIRDAAVIVFEFEKPIAPPPRLSSLRRPRRKSAGGTGTTDTGGDASKDSASPSPARRPRSLARGVSSSSPKTSGSDSSELHRPTPLSTAAASRPIALTRSSTADSTGGQGVSSQSDGKHPAVSPVDSKAAFTGAMSESLESYRESSSDSGKEQALPVFLVAGPSALVVSRPVHIDEPQSSDHAFTDDNWAARQRLRNDAQASIPFRLDHHFFMAAATSATLSTSTALNSSCFHEYSIGHGRTGMNMWLTNPFVFMLQALPVFLVAGPSALVVSRPVHIDEPQSSDHVFTDDNWAARQRLRNDAQASIPFRLDHHFFMAAATSATLSTSTALNSSCFHEYSIGHGRTGMNMWLTNPFVFMLQVRSAPRIEKKMALGARNARARITRGARCSPNVPRDLGARPKAVATWAAPVAHSSPSNGGIAGERGSDVGSSSPTPLTVWANPQSRPPTQYFQSLRQVQSKVDSGRPLHRCSGQVVRVPPFTIKSDMPPATAAVDGGTAAAEVVRPSDQHHSLQRGSTLGIASNNNLVGNGGADGEEEDGCDNSSAATGEPSPDASPDFVAEIDAESNLVSHCLQEAELLERELSRKLRKQKRGPDPNVVPYTRPPALRGGTTASASGVASGNHPHRRRAASTSETRVKSSGGPLTTHSRAASLHGPLPPSGRSTSSASAARSTHMTRSPGTGGAAMVVRIPVVSAPAMHLHGRAVSGSESTPPQRVSGIAVSTKPSIRR